MYQNDITALLIISVPFFAGLMALFFAQYLKTIVNGASKGDESQTHADALQIKISGTIQTAAIAFLKTEYYWLMFFVGALCIFFFVEEGIACENMSGVRNGSCYGDNFPGTGGYRLIICYIIGSLLSALAGYLGMLVATDCNVKAMQAAKNEKTGLNDALKVAFAGGAVMGFSVVGLALLGMSVLFFFFAHGLSQHYDSYQGMLDRKKNITAALIYLAGFSFGASSIALFARVAGGIYTKAADVGADLVGKVEQDFPEDSFYNPATIADNVGDNVGDVAGMGADLFESFVGSIVATATLAMTSADSSSASGLPDYRRVAFPFWIAGFGVPCCIIGFFFVSTKATMGGKVKDIKSSYECAEAVVAEVEGGADCAGEVLSELLFSLHKGIYISAILVVVASALIVWMLYEGNNGCNANNAANQCAMTSLYGNFEAKTGWKDWVCMLTGLLCGIFIGEATEYFTSYESAPTRSITKAGITGPATVIIQGLGIGMLSTIAPVVAIVFTIVATTELSGVYGAGVAAVGMLSTLAITLATDAYGPIADNAGGIAEMSHQPPSVRQKTDALDALGNTTAATGKGFAVGSAVLTAIAFINSFGTEVGIQVIATESATKFQNYFVVNNSLVIAGLLLGAMLPFLFAALTMLSVGKAATGIILEVRKQLNDKPLLRDLAMLTSDEEFVAQGGLVSLTPEQIACEPDCPACVQICTEASLYEMLMPGVIALFTPLVVGLLIGGRCLGGLLMGSVATGFLLAVMMNNAGGAWDNSKKYVENDSPALGDWKNDPVDGRVTKKTVWHAAVVVGDTVGDPFKDTSGPALNILIKLMSVFSLTCAKIFRDDWETYWIGIVFLIVACVLCGFIFYKVWWNDKTMELVNQRPPLTGECPTCMRVIEDPVDAIGGGVSLSYGEPVATPAIN